MQEYETEEQQVEAIKKWFKENGSFLIWTVIVSVAMVSVVKYWYHHQEVVRLEASESYSAMLFAANQDDLATADSKANALIEKHSGTTYADLATLYQAKMAVSAKDLDLAVNYLQQVIEQSKVVDLQYIAKARLARIKLAQGKPNEALTLFDAPKESSYFTLLQELKGDALLALNKPAEAKIAYQLAFEAVDEMQRPILKLKLEELGGLQEQHSSIVSKEEPQNTEIS